MPDGAGAPVLPAALPAHAHGSAGVRSQRESDPCVTGPSHAGALRG